MPTPPPHTLTAVDWFHSSRGWAAVIAPIPGLDPITLIGQPVQIDGKPYTVRGVEWDLVSTADKPFSLFVGDPLMAGPIELPAPIVTRPVGQPRLYGPDLPAAGVPLAELADGIERFLSRLLAARPVEPWSQIPEEWFA